MLHKHGRSNKFLFFFRFFFLVIWTITFGWEESNVGHSQGYKILDTWSSSGLMVLRLLFTKDCQLRTKRTIKTSRATSSGREMFHLIYWWKVQSYLEVDAQKWPFLCSLAVIGSGNWVLVSDGDSKISAPYVNNGWASNSTANNASFIRLSTI